MATLLTRCLRLLAVVAAVAVVTAGCQTPEEPSSLPWNIPADWEAEGMGLPTPTY